MNSIIELPVEQIILQEAVVILIGEYEGKQRVVYFESEEVASRYIRLNRLPDSVPSRLLFYRPGIKVAPHVIMEDK